MADSANYVFLPWARQGAAAGIKTTDKTPEQGAVVSVTVNLRVNSDPGFQQTVRLYGPGDVIGIDQQQIVRLEPRPHSNDFEPNYFPAIEFDRPDYPWLFTPGKADSTGNLRPWLCLIVVRNDRATIHVEPNRPLPFLEIKATDRDLELPDLDESAAWAHVQVAHTPRDRDSLRKALGGDPSLTVSRLLCPRRLDPLTDYVACVVPAFELGRRAGLGEQIKPEDEKPPLLPAWTIKGQPAPVTLPIYFHWEFRTGTGGDFESLVTRLKARKLPVDVGKRPMDISKPGFEMPDMPADAGRTRLSLEGALRAVEGSPDDWPSKVRSPFQKALQKILNTPWDIATNENKSDPIVGPPIYGCWQAARHRVEITATPTTQLNWLDELNVDPRHRAVAAFGTQVVQTQQEQLVASAWEQLGEIQRINQMRRQAQLGRAVNTAYHTRHFKNFSEETLLKVLAPAQARLVVESSVAGEPRALLSLKIAQSPVPANAVSAPLRRLANPRGVISSRFVTAGAPPISIIAKLSTATAVAGFAITTNQKGPVTLDRVSDNQGGTFGTPLKQTVTFARISQTIAGPPLLADFSIAAEGVTPKRTLLSFKPGPPDSRDADMFRKVVKIHQDHLNQLFTSFKTAPAFRPTNLFDVNTNSNLLESINPEKTIYARVKASQELAPGAIEPPVDRLEPFLDAPSFPQPMYEALRDLSQDFLFSGLEQVPADTVALLETNPEFVEAFLVGLNAEMSSELLWRNYPTDQRGTFFQQFWDTSVGDAQPDIKPIKTWDKHHLGENAPHTNGKLVLLIRGELLRRYPNSVIYATRAVKPTPAGKLDVSRKSTDERHPLFRGTLKPDVTFLGFDLTDKEALGEPPNDPNGWFFVIQQQPTEPRFGLDVADFEKPDAPTLNTWDDLSWRNFVKTEAELQALTHVSTKTVFATLQDRTWGKNSAHQAFITLQRPVRIAIHARQMIAKA